MTERSNLLNKFKVMIIKDVHQTWKKMDEHSENFSRVRNYKEEPELKDTIIEIKNTLEGINSRLDDTKQFGGKSSRNHSKLFRKKDKKKEKK